MAGLPNLTIHQAPTSPNATYADLIYVVSSPSSSFDQFKYVVDIRDLSGTTLYRGRQVPNGSGRGVFEIGKILTAQMDYTPVTELSGSEFWFQSSNNNYRGFEVSFGYEFGTTPSSSLEFFEPAVSASTGGNFKVLPAVVERDAGYFNFPSESFASGTLLTNMPSPPYAGFNTTLDEASIASAHEIYEGDIYTVSTLSDSSFNWNGGGFALPQNQQWRFVVYDATGVKRIDKSAFANNTPLTASYTVDSVDSMLTYFRFGYSHLISNFPDLFVSGGQYLTSSVDYPYYGIAMFPGLGSGVIKISQTLLFHVNACDPYNHVRFVFINKYGVYDYYSANKMKKEQERIERESYSKSYIPYDNPTNQVQYQADARGVTNWYNTFENIHTVETDYVSKATSEWLMELFESPQVYIQDGDDYIPVVITNTREKIKSLAPADKVFKYTISYRYANRKRSRS